MLILSLDSTDPFFNLAVDEFLLKESNEDFLILGVNDKSVIIGKHQIAHRETDTKFVSQANIPVIRRISGGGTVFHDPGNLNFSFVLKSEYGKQVDFIKYSLYIISFLSSIGVEAKFEGKNDLRVNGLKISGNAEHVYHDRILHHGTLLFNSDIELLHRSIRRDTNNYSSRAVISNPTRVINLINVLKDIDTIDQFKMVMMDWFLENYPGSGNYTLSDQETERIKQLADTKYRTWEWNYAYGPEYQFSNRFDYKGIESTCTFSVKEGIICRCEISGAAELDLVCKKLIGIRHMVEDVQEVFKKENIFKPGLDIFNFF